MKYLLTISCIISLATFSIGQTKIQSYAIGPGVSSSGATMLDAYIEGYSTPEADNFDTNLSPGFYGTVRASQEVVNALEEEFKYEMSLFYDLTNHDLVLTNPKNRKVGTFIIADISGKHVLSVNEESDLDGSIRINTSTLNAGVYFLLFNVSDQPVSRKFIVKP